MYNAPRLIKFFIYTKYETETIDAIKPLASLNQRHI